MSHQLTDHSQSYSHFVNPIVRALLKYFSTLSTDSVSPDLWNCGHARSVWSHRVPSIFTERSLRDVLNAARRTAASQTGKRISGMRLVYSKRHFRCLTNWAYTTCILKQFLIIFNWTSWIRIIYIFLCMCVSMYYVYVCMCTFRICLWMCICMSVYLYVWMCMC